MINREKVARALRQIRPAQKDGGSPARRWIHFLVLLSIVLPASSHSSSIDRVWVGDSIPPTIFTGTGFILSGSDSLWLNGRLLQSGVHYEFQPRRRAFALKIRDLTPTDTLRVHYRPAPAWLRPTYGRQPLLNPPPRRLKQPGDLTSLPPSSAGRPPGDVSISGAKTVRFSARSDGSSDFGQSLDMRIEGLLAENLRVVGSVSDRGYDPSYGTANSRLNELDKINLLLTSPVFSAQVGDISPPPMLEVRSGRRISGVSAQVSGSSWSAEGLVARPRGRFTTAQFYGRDERQGPYQVTDQGPGQAIVPGSETVWLDGERLERGVENDYTLDYPTGRITFAVNNPIDSRSRIEVDYEPLATEYRGEMFGGAAAVSLADSMVTVETHWVREGDDPDQRLVGELSEADRESLRLSGDSIAYRSGVRPGEGGAYNLVTDSLPDSVFQYVGENNGAYSLAFSYVGQRAGAYQYVGGGVYTWVGAESGEYLPVVRLIPPKRADYYRISAGLHHDAMGELSLATEQTTHDQNLFSPVDDDDNHGGLYHVRWRRDFRWNERDNIWSYEFRRREAEYERRQRLNRVDFAYHYLLPDLVPPDRDETVHQAELTLSPTSRITLQPKLSRLQYDETLGATRGTVEAGISLTDKILVSGLAGALRTELLNSRNHPKGQIDFQEAAIRYATSSAGSFGVGWEHDERRHNYDSLDKGTRYHRLTASWRTGDESILLEYHDEDSLRSTWQLLTERRRIVISSQRRLGPLGYNATVSRQWLKRSSGRESSFMGRLSYNLRSAVHGFDLSGTYLISNETRQARGLTYLEVEPGQGDYLLVDGRYIPDADGNYLQVEEILSEQSRVRRGEKSFRLRKEWPWGRINLDADIEEELLDDGDRKWWWVAPVYSDPDQPYLFYRRRYRAEARLWPVQSWHVINYLVEENRQQRRVVSGSPESIKQEQRLILRQGKGSWRFSQEARLFTSNRDSYYSGGGDIDGYRIRSGVQYVGAWGENGGGLVYRRAESALNQLSEILAIETQHRLALPGQGEVRVSAELYRQWLDGNSLPVSYTLTDNHDGSNGANWSLTWRWHVKSGWRLSVSFSGRHADNRSARVYGRSEVVAGF